MIPCVTTGSERKQRVASTRTHGVVDAERVVGEAGDVLLYGCGLAVAMVAEDDGVGDVLLVGGGEVDVVPAVTDGLVGVAGAVELPRRGGEIAAGRGTGRSDEDGGGGQHRKGQGVRWEEHGWIAEVAREVRVGAGRVRVFEAIAGRR